MKKSILLGAAALAAVTFAGPSADAGEVKLGGYYMFRLTNFDSNVTDEAAGADDSSYWVHRLQMNVDMKASDKSHAHARIRILDSQTAQGADMGNGTAAGSSTNPNATADGGADSADWRINQVWLETEAWGIGAKVGNMPISLNDNLLIHEDPDATSFATVMLSKTFGGVTAVGAVVKVDENAVGGASANAGANMGANDDDVDLYFLSLLGKGGNINYQATLAYLSAQEDSDLANTYTTVATDNTDNWWLALTLNSVVSGIDLTGTIIYEAGYDGITPSYAPGATTAQAILNQAEDGDFLVALRAKGKTGFGGWNGYAFYAGEDFTNISNSNAKFSDTWDAGGPGAQDLMNRAFGAQSGVTAIGYNNGTSAPTQNVWGIGAGLTVNAGGWTIRPMLDYASTVETDLVPSAVGAVAADEAGVDNAWGGTLILSTPIQKDTTLSLTGQYVDVDLTTAGGAATEDDMHQLMADIKMAF